MALFDAEAEAVSAAAALKASEAFVRRCRDWAEAEIARRRLVGKATGEWESYLRFTDHTLAELRDGRLDSWFEQDHPGDVR